MSLFLFNGYHFFQMLRGNTVYRDAYLEIFASSVNVLFIDHGGSVLLSSKYLPFSYPLVPPADGPQWGFLIHRYRVRQNSSQPAGGLCTGHLCPWWSGKNKANVFDVYIWSRFSLVDLSQLRSVLLQNLFSGKDLDQLKLTAKTQFGQVGLWFVVFPFPSFTAVECLVGVM